MAIPDYQSIMLPLLRLAAEHESQTFRAAVETLASEFALSDSERRELLPSGKQPKFDNRVGWARTYLTKAGLLESPKRGVFRITDRGREVLASNPKGINVSYLEQFTEFVEFRELRHGETHEPTAQETSVERETPEEVLESAYQVLREGLAAELLKSVMACSPEFFEQLVVDLLVKMGYGGSRREAGEAIGKSRDGGIDGIIKEDRLGLDIIYIQAKRWEGVVGRPEIQKFAGALQGMRANKGVFLTTSAFSREAMDFAASINSKIILIDGARLTSLMMDHEVGVTTEAVYQLKRIDSDYFSEE